MMKIEDADVPALLEAVYRADNPLARAMAESEAYQRVIDLRERLGASPDQLDLSIKSLTTLEDSLITVLPGFLASNEKSDDDILRFFRETAAYIGLTFTKNTLAEWRSIDKWLWGNGIYYRYTTTGHELPKVQCLNYSLITLTHQCWQSCLRGQRANLAAIVTHEKRRRPRARRADPTQSI
jgi:hypothetical protein